MKNAQNSNWYCRDLIEISNKKIIALNPNQPKKRCFALQSPVSRFCIAAYNYSLLFQKSLTGQFWARFTRCTTLKKVQENLHLEEFI